MIGFTRGLGDTNNSWPAFWTSDYRVSTVVGGWRKVWGKQGGGGLRGAAVYSGTTQSSSSEETDSPRAIFAFLIFSAFFLSLCDRFVFLGLTISTTLPSASVTCKT